MSTIRSFVRCSSAARNAASAALGEVGNVGVVVGATVSHPPALTGLNAAVLMPGVGAQGATFADADRVAALEPALVFPSVSRSVLSAGPDASDLRKRLRDLREQRN